MDRQGPKPRTNRLRGLCRPLDVAADAGLLLVFRYGFALQQGIERRTQVGAGDGHGVAGGGAVEATAVDEPALRIEDEEIRGAGGSVCPRHVLGGVI